MSDDENQKKNVNTPASPPENTPASPPITLNTPPGTMPDFSPLTDKTPKAEKQMTNIISDVIDIGKIIECDKNTQEIIEQRKEDPNMRRSQRISEQLINRMKDLLQQELNERLQQAQPKKKKITICESDIDDIANWLSENQVSEGASIQSEFSQRLLDLARTINLTIPSTTNAREYNKELRNIFNNIGIQGVDISTSSTASKDVQTISDETQMKNVWMKQITAASKEKGGEWSFCYLCGLAIKDSDSPEMEHKWPHSIAFGEVLHYRTLKYIELCDTPVMTLWTNFIKDNETLIWNLYVIINGGDKEYDQEAVNKAFVDVFTEFKEYIKNQCNDEKFDDNIFQFSTSLLKFWLTEYAYAHFTCNRGKGVEKLDTKKKINTFIDKAKALPGEQAKAEIKKTIIDSLKTQKDNILKKFKHLEAIYQEFLESYPLISHVVNLNTDKIKMLVFIKGLRAQLLYSGQCVGLRDPCKGGIFPKKNPVVTLNITLNELKRQLIDLKTQLADLQTQQANHPQSSFTRQQANIQKKIEGLPTEIDRVETEIDRVETQITQSKSIQSDIVAAANSEEDTPAINTTPGVPVLTNNYCNETNNLLDEEIGCQMVRNYLNIVTQATHNVGTEYNPTNDPPYWFADNNIMSIMHALNIPHFDGFYEYMPHNFIHDTNTPVIFAHHGDHWTLLYNTTIFNNNNCPDLDLNTITIQSINHAEGEWAINKEGYTQYFPRSGGDCGPDAVRVALLLYCCWIREHPTSPSQQDATMSNSSSDLHPKKKSKKDPTGSIDKVRQNSSRSSSPRLTSTKNLFPGTGGRKNKNLATKKKRITRRRKYTQRRKRVVKRNKKSMKRKKSRARGKYTRKHKK